MKNIFTLIALLVIQVASAQFLTDKKNVSSQDGFFKFYYNDDEGKLFLEVPQDKIDAEFIYVHSLKSGLGSNDIGLDRGQLGGTSIVKFIKAGNKLLLLEPNQKYRAVTDNAAEKRSIEQAFGKSILYGFKIEETKDKKYLVDLTDFLLEDAHGIISTLKRAKEGTYKIDKNKSAIAMENTKAFPKNTEFESWITLTGEPTGKLVRTVVPDANNITVLQHFSFVELPESGFEPREFDPRSGSFSISYADYSSPVYEPIEKRFITRHRLEKKNPEAAVSEAVEPIIYYLDPGTPEPVRSALIEGASWWNQAYEAIGYKDAFQVKMLPEGADMMDLRYNVIQWVHRSTRGWSYGASVTDPRTGEIIKGHVSLGSLRIRQDFMIAQAMMNKPFADSDENYQPMLDLALARIRQLGAHEVGHTLGFAHNFAASVSNRASVMDYPHPTLTLKDGEVDFSNAYDTGIGEWDKITVAYSYSDIPKGEQTKTFLDSILNSAQEQNLQFISDADARAASGAHPDAHLWDNGADAAQELKDVLALRQKAIQNFSLDNIRTGEPYTVLEDVFVPLYFYHRYQTEAAVKSVGGVDYRYAVKGDMQKKPMILLSPKEQKTALDAVLSTLQAENLAIPKDKLDLFPPRAYGYGSTRESFKGKTGITFDPLAAAETASDMTLTFLLNPERMNRIVANHGMDDKQFSAKEVINELIKETFEVKQKDSYLVEVQQTINSQVVRHLKNLFVHKNATPQVKAEAMSGLLKIAGLENENMAYAKYLKYDIAQFLEHPEKFESIPSPKIPDGSPIGTYQCINPKF